MHFPICDVAVFDPPYTNLITCPADMPLEPIRGRCVVWYLHNATAQREQYQWLLGRSERLPLFVVLPPAEAIEPILPLIPHLKDLHARGVLPNGPLQNVDPIRLLLRHAPRDLPSLMVSYFSRRGLLTDTKTRSLVLKIFELAPTITSIAALSKRLYTSRRSLGRFFEARGLPVPSHWLQFARLMFVATKLQANDDVPVFRIATQYGYPDGFTMSNQMKRLVGVRPTDVRENLGWEWFVEEWLELERRRTNG